MNKLTISILTCIFIGVFPTFGQYDPKYVETSNTSINGENYTLVSLSRKDERIKVKYFAAKDYDGTSVYDRFLKWSRNKNVVAYTSGTYMTTCEVSTANPVGICIDNGIPVNETIEDDMDGLVVVYATGGMVVSNLKDGDLTVTNKDGSKSVLNIRNAFQRSVFFKWASENSATVFQTHLFYFKNKTLVFPNGSNALRERRFLAVGKKADGSIRHFLVNLSGANTLYNATNKVVNYLKSYEDVIDLIFLINLDTGCQDVYHVNKSDGTKNTSKGFYGQQSLYNATNLIVYYYE